MAGRQAKYLQEVFYLSRRSVFTKRANFTAPNMKAPIPENQTSGPLFIGNRNCLLIKAAKRRLPFIMPVAPEFTASWLKELMTTEILAAKCTGIRLNDLGFRC